MHRGSGTGGGDRRFRQSRRDAGPARSGRAGELAWFGSAVNGMFGNRHGDRGDAPSDEQVRAVFSLLSSWRTASAIGSLESGPKRFGALLREMDGVSPKVLTRTLRRLEGFGMVERKVYPAVPAHVEYSLTRLGESVAAPLLELRFWVETHTGSLGGDGPAER